MTKSIIAIVVILAAGGGYYWYNSTQNPITNQQVEVKGNETKTGGEANMPSPSGKKMAFMDFVKQGGAYKCTVTQYVNNTGVEGTVYIDGGKISGEFSVNYGNANMTVSTIVKDGYSYSWTSMMPTSGFKVKVDDSVKGDSNAGASGSYSWDNNKIGDYNCTPWASDTSKFNLPATVKFTEMGK